MTHPSQLPKQFDQAEFSLASAEWGFNCGPGALCGITGLSPAEIRPHLLDFEQKGYTNPTLMYAAIKQLGYQSTNRFRNDEANVLKTPLWPKFGVVRIQWGGPWTNPGVPMAARYRKTHWIAARRREHALEVFDVNALLGGREWLTFEEWRDHLVPWLIKAVVEKGDGKWWPTHSIEMRKVT